MVHMYKVSSSVYETKLVFSISLFLFTMMLNVFANFFDTKLLPSVHVFTFTISCGTLEDNRDLGLCGRDTAEGSMPLCKFFVFLFLVINTCTSN